MFFGVVMIFEVGDEFEKGGLKLSMCGVFECCFKGNEIVLLFVLLMGFFFVVLGFVVLIFVCVFIDNFLI